jgi:hypothetical protein
MYLGFIFISGRNFTHLDELLRSKLVCTFGTRIAHFAFIISGSMKRTNDYHLANPCAPRGFSRRIDSTLQEVAIKKRSNWNRREVGST